MVLNELFKPLTGRKPLRSKVDDAMSLLPLATGASPARLGGRMGARKLPPAANLSRPGMSRARVAPAPEQAYAVEEARWLQPPVSLMQQLQQQQPQQGLPMSPANSNADSFAVVGESFSRQVTPSNGESPFSRQVTAEDAPPGGREAFPRQDEVWDIFEHLHGHPWYVLFPTQSNTSGQFLTLAQSRWQAPSIPTNPLDVPKDAKAVLVVSHALSTKNACNLVAELKASRADLPPVVVLLFGLTGSLLELDDVLEAQHELDSVGADDVVLASDEGTPVAIAMSLGRIGRLRATQLLLEERAEEVQALTVQVEELKDRHNRTFYSCAHRIFKDFPKMDYDNAAAPAANAKVGGVQLLEHLGQGGFGCVYSGRDEASGALKAVKVVAKERLAQVGEVLALANEVRLLARLRPHAHTVAFHGAVHARDYVFIFLELAGRTSLQSVIKSSGSRFPQERALVYGQQIASAIGHIHGCGVAHRDLKPENVVVSEDASSIKVVDFGLSVPLGQVCEGACGTMPFIAPEVLAGAKYDPCASDVWAWGVLLLEMVAGVGKLRKKLGWAVHVAPEPCRGRQLCELFGAPGGLAAALQDLVDLVPLGFQEVLAGALAVEPARRLPPSQLAAARWEPAAAGATGVV